GGTLGDGTLEGCEIICPRHGARFDIRTGDAVSMPATKPTDWGAPRTSARAGSESHSAALLLATM
ncbi:MAG: Rieske 2Fe-2S domain-containing protein, partial [Phycisphaerales bacterium]|nr:Rieske 2Fe-2S domain-containing protein [Phycisphaerales bacterium]